MIRNIARLISLALFVVVSLIIAVSDNRVRAFSTGPDPGRTGAPDELTCATSECHGLQLNSGPGRLTILVPPRYEPGRIYEITVRVET